LLGLLLGLLLCCGPAEGPLLAAVAWLVAAAVGLLLVACCNCLLMACC
jgi:hypothetical protein